MVLIVSINFSHTGESLFEIANVDKPSPGGR
jgi:hypothetical protein